MTAPLSPIPQEYSERLRDQLRRLLLHFEEMRAASLPSAGSWLPSVDLFEMTDAVVVKLELPGVAASNVRISVVDGVLRIEGNKETVSPGQSAGTNDPAVEKPVRYLCLERASGSFSRKVPLKWTIDWTKINARLSNGILEIRLPKINDKGGELLIPIVDA